MCYRRDGGDAIHVKHTCYDDFDLNNIQEDMAKRKEETEGYNYLGAGSAYLS